MKAVALLVVIFLITLFLGRIALLEGLRIEQSKKLRENLKKFENEKKKIKQ